MSRLKVCARRGTDNDALYSYGPAARRVRKAVGPAGSRVVTDFVHAGGMEIAEYDGNGALLRRYVPGPGIDQRVVMIECLSASSCLPGVGAVQRSYYFADRQGHVRVVTNAAGDLVQRFTYTPFGVEMEGDPTGNPFRYTGRRYDPETGLYYYRARYYDADLGRFLQVDPIGYEDQWNLYAYVGNNPLNATDPTGEATKIVITEVRNNLPFDDDFGAHAAVRVDNSSVTDSGRGNGEAVLYDPGGSHTVAPYPGARHEYRPSGDAFVGSEANLEDYVAHESRNGEQRVTVLTFDTTPEQEAQIADNIFENGGVAPFSCTSACSSVISGVGPFEDVTSGAFFPDRLKNELEQIEGVQIEVHDFRED